MRRLGPQTAAAVGLCLLGVLCAYVWFAPGRFADDHYWAYLWRFEVSDPGSLSSLLDVAFSADRVAGWRPGQRATQALVQWIGGGGPEARLIAALLLALVQAGLLFVVLRLLRLDFAPAASAALLLATAPWIDTTRLWFSSTYLTLASCFYLAGLAAALAGLRAARAAPQIGWHSVALVFYAAACTTVLFVGVVVVSAVLYWVAAGRRAAALRWPADLLVAIAVAVPSGVALNESRHGDFSIAHLWDRLWEALEALAGVLVDALPGDRVLEFPFGLIVVGMVAWGLMLAVRRGPPLAPEVRRWLAVAAVAAFFSIVGILPILPEIDGFKPVTSGIANRLAAGAAPGLVVVIVALIWLAALAVTAILKRPQVALPLACALVALDAIGYAMRVRDDGDAWESAAADQEQVLDAIGGAGVAPGDSVVTFGAPLLITGGFLPVFGAIDLEYAAAVRFDDRDLRARPFAPPPILSLVCGEAGAVLYDGLEKKRLDYPYGRLVFVNVPAATSTRIATRDQCAGALAAPGAR